MSSMQKRVVVVGAGPGGLASAMLLAASGVDVTIVEKRDHAGGRTSTFEQDGFRFDYGPTFFLYPRVLSEIFSASGYSLDREVPMLRLDPQYRLVFGTGGELLATGDHERMEAAIAKLCPRDAKNFQNFMTDNRNKLQRFLPFLESPFESWRDLARPEMLKLLPILAPWKSLDQELRQYFSDERIRLGFSFQSKYLGMSPFRCPGLFSILSFLEYEYGVFHPVGGCGAVTRAMARICEDMGVTILLNEDVEAICFEGRKATGVRTNQRTIQADSVVMNAEFAEAAKRMIPRHLRSRWTDDGIGKKDHSCSTFMLYLGVDGRYDEVSHHTIYLAKDYRGNLHDIEKGHTLSQDPSIYVQNASVSDDSLAPKGMSSLYVLAPVTHSCDGVDWKRDLAPFRERVLDQMANIGMGDVRSRIRTERVLTPANWAAEFALHKGSTFSMAHSLRQMLHLRPHNRFEETDGVYLAGGGTHPGSGLPVIFESARISSKLLLEDLGIKPAWNFTQSAFDQSHLRDRDLAVQ
ncbi:phytoene desaturase family protein [Terriglobus aquaticus]|uniref:Phytoene desaturase family protein n=1 Tax=Terriglobus aquaticus TaxID=940139 RepID=A0ABW9KI69_9BACT|nr:phytoene desaturase family protein [Terriglobus aquaticus]